MDDDGNLAFASFRGSPPDLAGPTFPRAGDLIVAELCSWGCDKAMEVLKHERLMDEQNRRVGGHGMRALAMAILFFPVILVAMAVPGMLGLSSTWSAVSLTLVGVLLSAVISEPLRLFLLEWGKLCQIGDRSPKRRAETMEGSQVILMRE